MEKREEIVVLDAGEEVPSLTDPEAWCCSFAFSFFRG